MSTQELRNRGSKKVSPGDAAVQQRIIEHMNASHRHNLEDFLVVYGGVPDAEVKDPKLDAVSLTGMTISYAYGPDALKQTDISQDNSVPSDSSIPRLDVIVPFDPVLNDYSEARDRMVEMSKKAAARRGFSAYKVRSVPLPNTLLEFVYFQLLGLAVYLYVDPNAASHIEELFGLSSPTAAMVIKSDKWLLKTIFVMHITEITLVLKPLLEKYRVEFPQSAIAYALGLLEGVIFINKFERSTENP